MQTLLLYVALFIALLYAGRLVVSLLVLTARHWVRFAQIAFGAPVIMMTGVAALVAFLDVQALVPAEGPAYLMALVVLWAGILLAGEFLQEPALD